MSLTTNLRWAREQRTGDWVAKAVLMVIASHTDRDGIAMLSYRTIADELERNEATVRRHVPVLIASGLIEQHIAKGRGKTRYRLLVDRVVRRHGAAQPAGRSAAASAAQTDLFSASPERRTSDGVSEPSGTRSAARGSRSAARQPSDQQDQATEVEAEVSTKGAPPSPPAGARTRTSAHAREAPAGRRRPEQPTAAELDRTAVRAPGAQALVAEWIQAGQRKVLSTHRRELNRAVDELLARRADRDLVLAALDHAHDNERFINPARMLPAAYSDVERAAARARSPVAAGRAATNGRIPTTTQRVQGALAHLDPEEP